MYGRATIRLGIGPHSSCDIDCVNLRSMAGSILQWMDVAIRYTPIGSKPILCSGQIF